MIFNPLVSSQNCGYDPWWYRLSRPELLWARLSRRPVPKVERGLLMALLQRLLRSAWVGVLCLFFCSWTVLPAGLQEFVGPLPRGLQKPWWASYRSWSRIRGRMVIS